MTRNVSRKTCSYVVKKCINNPQTTDIPVEAVDAWQKSIDDISVVDPDAFSQDPGISEISNVAPTGAAPTAVARGVYQRAMGAIRGPMKKNVEQLEQLNKSTQQLEQGAMDFGQMAKQRRKEMERNDAKTFGFLKNI